MPGKVSVLTLGCSKNRVDSEHLMRQLLSGGWQVIPDAPEEEYPLDVLIINTCGFIHDAKMESIECILEALEAKKKQQIGKVFVIGCLSGRYPSELGIEMPQVDAFFGVNDIPGVAQAMGVRFDPRLQAERLLSTPGHYAYLKLSEGCDRGCAYCAIPLIRGRHVSRPADQLIAEARNLAGEGVRELILVAQDTSYYGLDLTQKRELAPLMESLCRIDGIEWIRLLYTYPQGFPIDVLSLMAQEPKICQYVDIPLQHVSDKVLSAMRRNTTGAQTRELIEKFRIQVPGICLRTTFIVGHPGEDSAAFNELLDFVAEARFERMGAFMYSQEEGTYGAMNLEDRITEKVKASRYKRLMELQQDISYRYNLSRIGKTYRILVDSVLSGDEEVRGTVALGRTMYEAPEVDGQVIIENSVNLQEGVFAQAEIVGANEYDLYAKIK